MRTHAGGQRVATAGIRLGGAPGPVTNVSDLGIDYNRRVVTVAARVIRLTGAGQSSDVDPQPPPAPHQAIFVLDKNRTVDKVLLHAYTASP